MSVRMRRVICAIAVGLLGGCAKTTERSAAADGGGGRADGARAEASPTGGAGGAAGGGGASALSPCDEAKANRSASGCEFYSVAPAADFSSRGYCFAALLTNTWTSPVTIQVSYFGMPLNVAGLARTTKGTGQSLTYERQPTYPGEELVACPPGVEPGITLDPSILDSGSGKAFRITTDAPVAAYDIYPYGGAKSYVSSATLLIPTSAWGTNYMAVDAYAKDPALGQREVPFVQIVAAESATKVTISPKVAIKGGGFIVPTPAMQPQVYMLSRGEVLQFAQPEELAGSPIVADKPIGVWGGSACMNIPAGFGYCDGAHQQILPVNWLGSEYVAVRHRDRWPDLPERVPWTLVGAVDGTALTYDPAPPNGAPATLDRGQVVRFGASDPFVVRSNDDRHPFYVAGHMTSSTFPKPYPPMGPPMRPEPPPNPIDANRGDPEFVNAVPPQQWLPQYTFLTDVTYKNTHLVFIRQRGMDMTFKDVSLDCIGPITGWAPVGTGGRFQLGRVDFDKQPGGCMDGAHTAHSDASFGLTVWGWDQDVSYAYPAGLSTKAINTVVVPVVE